MEKYSINEQHSCPKDLFLDMLLFIADAYSKTKNLKMPILFFHDIRIQ